jgi:hypothetical protein
MNSNSSASIIESIRPLPIIKYSLGNSLKSIYNYISEKYDNFDWYLEVDHSSFVFMSNLKRFLKKKNSSMCLRFDRNSKFSTCGLVILLSRAALKHLARSIDTCKDIFYVNCCLNKMNIHGYKVYDILNRELFHEKNLQIEHRKHVYISKTNANFVFTFLFKGIENFSDKLISLHDLNHEEIYRLYYFYQKLYLQNNLRIFYVKEVIDRTVDSFFE